MQANPNAATRGILIPAFTTAQVARLLDVDHGWIYEHRHALGAWRVGEGPQARLAFDPNTVALAAATIAPQTAS